MKAMFDYIPARQDVLCPTTCRVYRNTAEYADYLTARFAFEETTTFSFNGERWVFSHSGADDDGMFDVLRLAQDSVASGRQVYDEDAGHEEYMRERVDLPGFFTVTVPMSILRALLPPVLTSDRTVSTRSGRA
jgi:hypothetical protein